MKDQQELLPMHKIRRQIADVLETVHDPEIPGISIVDLGMVLDIRNSYYDSEMHLNEVIDSMWQIDLAPTYSGCPAIDVIPFLAKAALQEAGYIDIAVSMNISPPWSTDWISETGKQKLEAWGIAPPNGQASMIHDFGTPKQCPQCGSVSTSIISQYGATPCKAVYRCDECEETFDYFKCY